MLYAMQAELYAVNKFFIFLDYSCFSSQWKSMKQLREHLQLLCQRQPGKED